MTINDKNIGQFIEGQWDNTGAQYEVINPATHEVLARIKTCGAKETTQAIKSADKALPTWSSTLAGERAKILKKWAALLLENEEELGRLVTLEQGKPLAEAKGEVGYTASYLNWFSEEAVRMYGDAIPAHKNGVRIVTIQQAIGVVGLITPWNFPLGMLGRKLGAALAAGCTAVIKPSELTPLSASRMLELGKQAGLPAGVVNMVSGDAVAIGNVLCESKVVKKISFTGSTRVGKLLIAQSADTVKKMSLELGGNAPFIVFEDADIDAAIEGALVAKYRNTGQTCICSNRFYIQESVYDAFVSKLAERTKAMKLGNGMDEGVLLGPLINKGAMEKVQAHVDDAKKKGAKVVCGGVPSSLGGTFFEATVLSHATNEMLIEQEETFGPVAACFSFKEEEDVIARANDTDYGLAAYFYTKDLSRSWRIAEALEYGMIGINDGLLSTAVAPFGGVKQSGLGTEGSKYGLAEYTEIKYILMGGI